jgi:hypothetical protein
MKFTHPVSKCIACPFIVFSALAAFVFTGAVPGALGQNQTGFTYNGVVRAVYSNNDLGTPADSTYASFVQASGANNVEITIEWFVPSVTGTTIAASSTASATDAQIIAAIEQYHSLGVKVFLKPQVDIVNYTAWRGTLEPTSVSAWFTSYQAYITHYATLAQTYGVDGFSIGTEFKTLSVAANLSYWQTLIAAVRADYSGPITYGANATSAGDEFTTVSFWSLVDIIGVDGYFGLTDLNDPTVSQLEAAWTDSTSKDTGAGFNAVAALHNLSNQYSKPVVFTELGYESSEGTNEQPSSELSNGYDPTEQANCYTAFFNIFSQQTSWMQGVFWWDLQLPIPSAGDQSWVMYGKPAGDVMTQWYGGGYFNLTPTASTLSVTQGSSATDMIAVTGGNGFTGSVTVAASGLPSGVTAAFATNPVTGSSVLTLTASGTATTGAATVTITGTDGGLATFAPIALTVNVTTIQSFALTSSASSLSFAQGGSGSSTITVTPSGGFTGGVTLTASGLPSGVAAVFATNPTTGSSVVTLTASSTAAIGAATVTITGTSGTLTASVPIALTVQPPMQVPTTTGVVVSQVNWLASLVGYVQTSNNPTGGSFAVNSYGEIAVADTDNIYLINAQTGVVTTLGAWSGASAVAIDSKNNIYVGNLYGTPDIILKIPYVGGSANDGYAAFTTPTTSTAACTTSSTTECSVPHVGTFYPDAMAFDSAGDLFWITSTTGLSGGNGIWECTVACLGGTGNPVEIYLEPTATTPPSTSSGQLIAGGLAIDPSGNVFFTDSSTYVNTSTYAYTSFYSDLDELPTSTGVGYGGKTTGYAASPTVLYTITPATPTTYDNKLDGVAVNATTGTVYFADESDGVFAFPNNGGPITLASGQPAALYAVSTQGAKTMTVNRQGNLYLAASSTAFSASDPDTVAQLTIDNLMVPASPVGTAVSPSATINPVTTLVNDAACSSSPAPSVTFAAGMSSTATATVGTTGTCVSILSGGASFATAVSFNPVIAGTDGISLTATDQSGKTEAVAVVGVGSGFTLAPSPATLSVAQGSSNSDTVTVIDGGGFTGAVTLAATGLPSGVTYAFSAGTVSGTQVLTLTASSTATIGGPVTVTITGTSGSLTASTTVALTVTPPPSFTLSPSPASVTVAQGGSGTSTITVTGANGFTGSVALATSGLPSGVTAAFATNLTTGSSVLTLTASSTATAGGPVTVTINGTSGALTASTTVDLTVTVAPSFALAPGAGTLSVTQGNNNTDTITVTPANGFTGGVTLAASGLPSGVTASFSPNPTTTGSAVLTLNAGSTATTGAATVTISGTSGALTESTTIALTVNVAPGFTLAPSPASVTVIQGSNGTSTISVTDVGGFTGGVILAASGLPSGVTAAFATNPATGSSVLTLTASNTATTGAATVTITGTSGTLTASTTIALTVNVPPSFTLAPSASTLPVTQGSNATDTITVTGANGFTASVTLAASGLPSGVTAAFATNPTTGSSVLTLTASSTATIGAATVTITGTSGTLTASTTIALTVKVPPSFTLASSASTLPVTQGSNATDTITVTDTGGFTGSVTLAASGLPSGVTAAFATNPTTGSSVITLTASSTVTIGAATVTITGTSGSLTASTTVALTVNAAPTVTVAPSASTLSVTPGGNGTSTITITPSGGFTGSVTLAAAITSSPTSAQDLPTLSFGSTSPVVITGASAGTATLTVSTTAASAALVPPLNRGTPWYSGGIALACILFFGIPARRRAWRTMLGMVVLLGTLTGGVLGCGGGGSSSSSSGGSGGTTPGAYTVTVTATSGTTISATGTINVTVQ